MQARRCISQLRLIRSVGDKQFSTMTMRYEFVLGKRSSLTSMQIEITAHETSAAKIKRWVRSYLHLEDRAFRDE